MKLTKLVLAIGLFGMGVAHAVDYTYVGSYTTNGSVITFADGTSSSQAAPHWTVNPPVYSGLDAAALLFGGSVANYAISTDRQLVNNLAWYDGWGDHNGHQYAENYKLDLSGLGYNGCATAGISCGQSAYSAYISDGFSGTNYVFRVAAVPEPESYAMLLAGLGLMTAVARRRAQK